MIRKLPGKPIRKPPNGTRLPGKPNLGGRLPGGKGSGRPIILPGGDKTDTHFGLGHPPPRGPFTPRGPKNPGKGGLSGDVRRIELPPKFINARPRANNLATGKSYPSERRSPGKHLPGKPNLTRQDAQRTLLGAERRRAQINRALGLRRG